MNLVIKQNYPGIDVIKFIMAFAVVSIHAPEYLWPEARVYPEFFRWFIRLAVPFFFIVSGFLIQGKLDTMNGIEEQSTYLRKRSLHIFRIWCVWLLIYLPLTVWGNLHSNAPVSEIVRNYFENVVFTGRSLYAQPLWFLYSMAIAFMIWSVVVHWLSKTGLLILFCLVLCGNILINLQPANLALSKWMWGGVNTCLSLC